MHFLRYSLVVRDEDLVNDMHDAVRGGVVGSGDVALVVDDHGAVLLHDVHLLALVQRLDAVKVVQVLAVHRGARHDVVLEDGLQLLDVGRVEEALEVGGRELGERLVGGREDGERVLGLEGGGQVDGRRSQQ